MPVTILWFLPARFSVCLSLIFEYARRNEVVYGESLIFVSEFRINWLVFLAITNYDRKLAANWNLVLVSICVRDPDIFVFWRSVNF